MHYSGKQYRTVWFEEGAVLLIDQRLLPFEFSVIRAPRYADTCDAIRTMAVRGAPAIGAAGGFAMAQAFREAPREGGAQFLEEAKRRIESTRPTGQNLFAAVERVFREGIAAPDPPSAAAAEALRIADEDVACCQKIGEFGAALLRDGSTLMTHCNAGWLACVDFGTALAPVYRAHRSGKKIFVYVSETRPRSQGAKLTAWELRNEGVPFAIFADGAGAHLMRKEKIDLVIVGADRIARNGDVANKIGTLEKAIAARELGIPFYVAAPTSTIDPACGSGDSIPIESRDASEILVQTIRTKGGELVSGYVYAEDFTTVNPAFDVTPAMYITGYLTERGLLSADQLPDFSRGISG